jgi:hypothetical protein
MEILLLILAALATSAAILQIVAKQGRLGPAMHGWAVRYSYPKETLFLACILWVAWYFSADL